MRNTENETVAAMRSGFTLIEILVAVAIIGIMGTVAAVGIPRLLNNARISAASTGVKNIRGAVISYQTDYSHKGKLPNSLSALLEGDEPYLEGGDEALEDPWGTEYKLEKKGRSFVIISAGPDATFGTEDDIRSDGKAK